MDRGDITALLDEAYSGREGAFDEVMKRVYADLQRIAERRLRDRFGAGLAGATLEPAALVNEAYLRLIKQRNRYDNRGQFFAIATRVMMRVLLDYHRSRSAEKRGGGQVRVTLSGLGVEEAPESSGSIPAFVEAIERLTGLDERTADVLKLRLLWGLTHEETAQALGVSLRTVEREWRFARKWLAAELGVGGPSKGM